MRLNCFRRTGENAFMRPYAISERSAGLIERLLLIWESSVRATHHFLAEKDIETLRPIVRNSLVEIPTLIVAAGDDGLPVAFMGIDGNKIEMLFVSPEVRGKGWGRRLVLHGLREFGADTLDVNEDNPQGVGFYKHIGFEIVGRSTVDGQGNPFPLLHMKFLVL